MKKTEEQRIQFLLSLISPKLTSLKRIKLLNEVEDLTGFDLVFILSLIIRYKYSGILNISNEKNENSRIAFIYGDIVKFDCSDQDYLLGDLIVESEIIAKYEMDELVVKSGGQRIGDYLVKNRYLTEVQLRKILFKQSRLRLTKYLNENKVNVKFVFDGESIESILISSVNYSEILYRWVFETYTAEWLAPYCEYYAANFLQININNDAYVALKDFPQLHHFTDALQNEMSKKLTFDRAFEKSHMSADDFNRTIHYMVLAGFIIIRKNRNYAVLSKNEFVPDQSKLNSDLAKAKILMLKQKYFAAFGVIIKYSSISTTNKKVNFYMIWVKLIGAFYQNQLLDTGTIEKKIDEIGIGQVDQGEFYFVKSLLAALQKKEELSDEFYLKAMNYNKIFKKYPIRKKSSLFSMIKSIFD